MCPFQAGAIIHQLKENSNYYLDSENSGLQYLKPEDWPEFFEECPWWHGLEPKDVPHYLRALPGNCVVGSTDGKVYEVQEAFYLLPHKQPAEGFSRIVVKCKGLPDSANLHYFVPATAEEFEAQEKPWKNEMKRGTDMVDAMRYAIANMQPPPNLSDLHYSILTLNEAMKTRKVLEETAKAIDAYMFKVEHDGRLHDLRNDVEELLKLFTNKKQQI